VPALGFTLTLTLTLGSAPALGFILALALGFAMMTPVKPAGGNALLQLLQLEIQVFHRLYLLSIWNCYYRKELDSSPRKLLLCKPRQSKLHPWPR
jgi:hypothetical protein